MAFCTLNTKCLGIWLLVISFVLLSFILAHKTSQLDLVQIKQSIRVVSARRLPSIGPRVHHVKRNATDNRPDWLKAMVDTGDALPERHVAIINQALSRRESMLRRVRQTNSSRRNDDRSATRGYDGANVSIRINLDAGVKYLLYQPSGGFNNQRIFLHTALFLAASLNRTLLLPPLCRHTSYVPNYNKEPLENSISLLDVFEAEGLKAMAKVVDFGKHETLMSFLSRLEESRFKVETFDLEGLQPISASKARARWKDLESPVLFLTKFWQRIRLLPDELDLALRHVRLREDIRQAGRVVTNRLFKNRFNSVHVRFDDREKMKRRRRPDDIYLKHVNSTKFLRAMRKARLMQKSSLLYVSTMPSMFGDAFFRAFESAGFELIYSDKLLKETVARQFLQRFPKPMRQSILGVLEQLVCSDPVHFLDQGLLNRTKECKGDCSDGVRQLSWRSRLQYDVELAREVNLKKRRKRCFSWRRFC